MLRALPALLLLPSCVVVDAPFLGLRSVAGGLHNARQASGIRPFFLPDGRLGVSANGALALEDSPGGPFAPVTDAYAEIDDPAPSPDGATIVFTSGKDLVHAGGGHKDHVFQLCALDLASGDWTRLSRSRRAESLPRYTSDGEHLVFVRRPEYDGWSLDDPWSPGALYASAPDGTDAHPLTEALFHPFVGLELAADDTLVVFGARADEDSSPAVWTVPFPGGGEPRLLLESAYLPTPIPGTDELLVARPGRDGHRIERIDLEGRTLALLATAEHELGGLAIAPDGGRVAWSELDPDAGKFGTYRLWTLEGDGPPVLREELPYREETRFKPLDVVKPPSWWFDGSRSPGSR